VYIISLYWYIVVYWWIIIHYTKSVYCYFKFAFSFVWFVVLNDRLLKVFIWRQTQQFDHQYFCHLNQGRVKIFKIWLLSPDLRLCTLTCHQLICVYYIPVQNHLLWQLRKTGWYNMIPLWTIMSRGMFAGLKIQVRNGNWHIMWLYAVML